MRDKRIHSTRRNEDVVLSRRIGEQIVIDGNIRVMVIAINGDKVRLGTSAPPSVTVDRSEVHERRGELRTSVIGRNQRRRPGSRVLGEPCRGPHRCRLPSGASARDG